jgi:ubiquinone/menaquinone biosynthesis C-methylase UbiE
VTAEPISATPTTPAPTTAAHTTPATSEQVAAAWSDSKLANILYHDYEAGSYDEKWSISFDQRCIDYARDRFTHVAGTHDKPFAKSLELGCGTGFFTLNLKLAGIIDKGYVSDLSPGMVEVARRNAHSLGFEVSGRVADAERLPYDDDSFDLVIGHAVLHHIPDVELALREVLRVLEPGGRFVFAGEPTKHGAHVARLLSRATWWAAMTATRPSWLAGWRRAQAELDESSRAAALEVVVDLHTFAPEALRRTAIRAGAIDVGIATTELTAAWFGWSVRTFECALPRDKLGLRWANFAVKGWEFLSAVDEVLAHIVPKGLFYNVEITGLKP